jgi:hypothetical protein
MHHNLDNRLSKEGRSREFHFMHTKTAVGHSASTWECIEANTVARSYDPIFAVGMTWASGMSAT